MIILLVGLHYPPHVVFVKPKDVKKLEIDPHGPELIGLLQEDPL